MAEKTFQYHADASAIGGYINRPFNGFIPSHTSLSLPIVGGFVQKERKRTRPWKDIINFSSESTHVSGSKQDEPNDGPWTTQVSATVENLNILDVITADKIVAQLSVSHPHDGGEPTIAIVGTQFMGLRISGHKYEPVIRYDLFAHHDGKPPEDPKKKDRTPYPQKPWPRQERFLEKVKTQFSNAKKTFLENYPEQSTVPDWIADHFQHFDSDRTPNERDYVPCSLIDQLPELPGNIPGVVCKNAVYLFGFGKVFFGELHIHNNLYRLSMIRVQLGSPIGGAASVCTASSNGKPTGPGGGG
jgi:hypothetical protein